MFDDSVFAIDGSKFKAVNNKSKNYTPSKVQFHIDRVEKSIEKYLCQMDTKDKGEKATDTKVSTSKLAWLEARLVKLKTLEKEVMKTLTNKCHKLTQIPFNAYASHGKTSLLQRAKRRGYEASLDC
jgi:hypothetical protein